MKAPLEIAFPQLRIKTEDLVSSLGSVVRIAGGSLILPKTKERNPMVKPLRVLLVLCGLLTVSILGAVQPRTTAASEKSFRHPGLRVNEDLLAIDKMEAATRSALQASI